mgnify:CR=1 FL=1|jgi:hypothetical protein
MDPGAFSTFAEVLQATGPYGLVCVLGWAFWRVNEKKDASLQMLCDRLAELSEAQTAAMVKVEHALVALKEAIRDVRRGP